MWIRNNTKGEPLSWFGHFSQKACIRYIHRLRRQYVQKRTGRPVMVLTPEAKLVTPANFSLGTGRFLGGQNHIPNRRDEKGENFIREKVERVATDSMYKYVPVGY
jgi:hypothetical protein